MPADDPQVGEIWVLPNQPTLTTAGEGGTAVVALIVPGTGSSAARIELISELQGRRLHLSLRSFLLSWTFVRAIVPEQCYQHPCPNPAWFNQLGENGGDPYCLRHFDEGRRIYFWIPQDLRCPACQVESGLSLTTRYFDIYSCTQCRRDWIRIQPSGEPALVTLVMRGVRAIEDRGFTARLRLGSGVYDSMLRTVGSFGDPPQLQGVPIAVGGEVTTLHIIGRQPKEAVRGVQRLGGLNLVDSNHLPEFFPRSPESQESTNKTYTNTVAVTPRSEAPRDLSPGAKWWHKSRFDQVFIVDVSSDSAMFVKFRVEGVIQRLSLEAFMGEYQVERPTPPCQVSEEWHDSLENLVTVVELFDDAANVRSTDGVVYLLPYRQFPRWKKVERKSIYDRLNEDD